MITQKNNGAALIADGEALKAALDAYEAADSLRESIYSDVRRIEARIAAAQAHTPEGLAVQAQVG